MQHDLGNLRLELVTDDIADRPDVDALVNAANRDLRPGAGGRVPTGARAQEEYLARSSGLHACL